MNNRPNHEALQSAARGSLDGHCVEHQIVANLTWGRLIGKSCAFLLSAIAAIGLVIAWFTVQP
jgi:hypothetical protein